MFSNVGGYKGQTFQKFLEKLEEIMAM